MWIWSATRGLARAGEKSQYGTIELRRVVKATDGFSGAEIETVVVGALYRAVGDQLTLDTNILLAEIASTVLLSASRREEIAALRHWAQQRAHAA